MPPCNAALITGASSGIGRALALALAAPGVTLHLGGRDAARLADAAAACRAAGAAVETRAIDVTDRDAMAAWIAGAGPLDLVVANAGISAGTGDGTETPAQTRAIFAANLDGMLNTVLPALAAMRARPPGTGGRRGTIAVVASIAAFLPTPNAPAYGASKAAADAWTVATATAARAEGIRLVSVCPGFIATPMTQANPFPMPGLMTAERAARTILAGLAGGSDRIVFPWWMGCAARLAALLPWARRAMARQPAKPALPGRG
jgi:short-subunit dehydrogenase